MKYESTFNALDNILRNEAGCSNELDYIEHARVQPDGGGR